MFELLRARWSWTPIANCPGRFVLSQAPSTLTPGDVVGPNVELREFRVPSARDVVVVGRFADGGLISYRRCDGTYKHTLNTAEGFARKLTQLGVEG